jgi:hypothetical protein
MYYIREINVRKAGDFVFNVGFSDQLTFQINDEVVFAGENLYQRKAIPPMGDMGGN